jgi:hypothetical protein
MNRFGSMARALACLALPALLAGCWWDDNKDAAPAGASYSVGGSITGLASAGLVLTNGTDTVSPASGATTFTFGGMVAQGGTYAVTVKTQPAGAACSVANGSGTIAGANVGNVAVTCAATTFTVGGSISGLTTSGLVLANGTDTVSPAANATGFTLPTGVASGGAYTVTIKTQPAGEQCSLTNSTGTIAGANVTNVAVACAALTHTLGGTISGLPSSGLVLANGSDTVSPGAGALSFTFTQPVAEGGAYAVSVKTQPTGATCSVGSGTGTMGMSNVATVAVTCAANAYKVGGTIGGLTASGLILANGTDTVSPAANATSFTFAQSVAFGGSYSVTVKQQPAGLTCSVGGSFPATMGAGDVSNVGVTCAAASGLQVVVGQLSCPVNAFADGNGANASVPAGEGMTFDASGNLYVTGGGTKVVRKITPAGDVTTLAGVYGQGGSTDGTGANARFSFPQAIALDSTGNLYVGDSLTVRKVTLAGVVTTLAGNAGAQGFGDATGVAARFGGVKGIATDTAGNAYIADANNNVIRKMTPAGVVTTFAGGGSAGGSAAGFADGSGTAARFSAPTAVAIDAAGNLYVTDYLNWAIRKITPAGLVSTLAGGGPTNPGFADGTGSAARFGGSTSIAMGPGGSVYVLDQAFSAIRLVSAAGVVTTLGTAPNPSPTGPIASNTFVMFSGQTAGIGADSSGALYVSAGCAIQKVGP